MFLELYSNPFGSGGYILTFALAQIINKHSPWLRATCIETGSSTVNLRKLTDDPEKAAAWVGFMQPCTIYMATVGLPPFEEPTEVNVKGLASMYTIGNPVWTLDPNLKKPEDLIGKRIASGMAGTPDRCMLEAILENWGILDKVQCLAMGGNERAKTLIDGRIDAAYMGVVMGAEGDWIPVPYTEEVLSSRDCFVFSIDEEDVDATREGSDWPIFAIHGIGKTFGRTTVPAWTSFGLSLGWFVSGNMPDDTVAELIRIIYEYADEFKEYHATGARITRGTLGDFAMSRDDYHPVAIEFLEDKGLKVGR